jgi:3-dehydroquinate synthase
MKRLQAVTGSRSYEVVVARDCLPRLGELLRELSDEGEVLVGCDEHVAPLYLEPVCQGLRQAGFGVSQVVIPAGEVQKSLARAEELYGVLYDRSLGRRDTVVALGGGVVGDLFGFVAATYQRGLRLVQAPTTLLAQVDAGVGGKTGVDFRAGKNYVGTFYQPWLVVADPTTLATLPQRELVSGAAEVAKYGLLRGGALLTRCEALAAAGLSAQAVEPELLAGCVQAKLEVVAADERELTGVRAVLNLGHTLGHAIEAAGRFSRFTHGEAVALGLRAALWLSQRVTGLSADEAERGLRLLDGLGLPRRLRGVGAAQVCELVRRDKKAGPQGVGYVLLEALGTPLTGVPVTPQLEHEAVAWLMS